MILSPCRKLSYLSSGKRATSSSMFFWRYYKDMQTSYFGFLGHAWLRTLKMIMPTCRNFCCFSLCQDHKKNALVSGKLAAKNLHSGGHKYIFSNLLSGDILFSSLASFSFLVFLFFLLVCSFFEIKKYIWTCTKILRKIMTFRQWCHLRLVKI